MENLIVTSMLVFTFYAWLFSPKTNKSKPVEHSLEVVSEEYKSEEKTIVEHSLEVVSEECKQEAKTIVEHSLEVVSEECKPEAKTIVEQLPSSKYTASKSVKNELSSLSIRELKKLASKAKIKNYGNMRKTELIKVLS